MLRRTFKYRLYPTRRQERLLLAQLQFTRNLYNAALAQRIWCWRDHGRSISYLEQSRELTKLRRDCPECLPHAMSRSAQQYALRRLDRAFEDFFRRLKTGQKPGFPRFKGVRRWDTLQAQYGKGAALRDAGRLYWQGVGHVKAKVHRPIPEHAERKVVSLKRQGRCWYACVEVTAAKPKSLPATGEAVGVDLGITTFATLSTGEFIEGPRAQRRAEKRVARIQRDVARKQKGSNRRRKAVERLARARLHEARVRRDHHFKTARSLVERYDVVCIEDLHVKGLADSILAKDVRDQAWGQFARILADKAEEAGRLVVLVNPKNTSQICSGCERLVPKALGVRTHACSCGLTLDRDVNAARNILRLGASQQPRSAAESSSTGRAGRAGSPHRKTSPPASRK